MKKRKAGLDTQIEVMKLMIGKYPVAWKAKELSLTCAAAPRTIERMLKRMIEAGLVEKRYHDYVLSREVVTQFYGARWYVKQEIDKELIISQSKKGDPK